jgi:uncharacterized protein (TIGR02217 family)
MFIEARFPINISYGAIGGCGWSTRIVTSDGGFEYRQALWELTRGRWNVGHELRSPAEWAELIAFPRLARRRLYGFRFQEWTAYQLPAGQGVLITNSQGQVQLTKPYLTADPVNGTIVTSYRSIQKPQPGTVTFDPPGPTVDYATGVVSDGTVGATTWGGNFDVPVRFDTDLPELSYDLPDGVGWRGIPVVEIRPPGS